MVTRDGRRPAEREYGQRLEALLDALEALPANERESYLARVRPDPHLYRDVQSFLACESESEGYLERFEKTLVPKRAAPPDLAGKRIGAWRLLRPLGRGGMGLVYEAERVDGAYEQRTALKLLTTALVGTEAYRAFLAERRILAGLEHPAIARIVDGGVTEEGTPWFAMEHVEGQAIDAYCDRRRLGIRERLELFLQVCDAVEHAHRRLVVHRDLKPANVLVTEGAPPPARLVGRGRTGPHSIGGGAPSRATPQVKLLDFGIAKLLQPERAAPGAPPTRTILRMMTPEYASPEQVRGEPMTIGSDVYQLGLLLYELLSGHRPYSLRRYSAGELEQVICKHTPTRLSAAIFREDTVKPLVGCDSSSVDDVCRARRASPARLRRSLRGDLDSIVLKALSKKSSRRYGSADRLAQDIRRHLAGLPVTARSDTFIYRGQKFFKRHALAASAIAAGLILAAGMMLFHMVRIQSERDRVEAALARVQAEAAKAEQVSEFLTDLFEQADPREARSAELTARELLDLGAAQIDRELAEQPELQAQMLHVLGRTYLELGVYDSAEHLLLRALELRQSRLGVEHPDAATTVASLGLLRYRQGEYERARELLEEASRNLETLSDGQSPRLADALSTLAETYRRLNRYQEALTAIRRALAIQREVSGHDSLSVAEVLPSLGALLLETGAPARAEDLYERALAIHERELGTDHPRVGVILMNLASVRLHRGQLSGLEAMYRRSLAIQEAAYGSQHRRVAMTLNNLGNFLSVSGQSHEAIDVLRRALESQSAALGPSHPDTAYPLASLGDAHLASGRLREARSYYQQSVQVREEALRTLLFDPVLFHCLVGLGRTEVELGDRQAAARSLRNALAEWNRAPESQDPRLEPSVTYLGRWLAEGRRCADAVPLLRRALRLRVTKHGPSGAEVAELESLLTECASSPTLDRSTLDAVTVRAARR